MHKLMWHHVVPMCRSIITRLTPHCRSRDAYGALLEVHSFLLHTWLTDKLKMPDASVPLQGKHPGEQWCSHVNRHARHVLYLPPHMPTRYKSHGFSVQAKHEAGNSHLKPEPSRAKVLFDIPKELAERLGGW